LNVYTFKHSDRLDKIAAEHGVTVERLRAVNGLRAKANPVIGQQLLVPEKGSAAATEPLPPIFAPPGAAGGRVVQYQVKKGDTVSSIARTLGAKLADVRAANGGDQLAIGKTLSIAIAGSTKRPTRSAAKKTKPAANAATAKTPPPAQPAPPPQVARRSSAS
jgi:LysM repeat protein